MTELLTSWLRNLNNASHFSIVSQIRENLATLETENTIYNAALTELSLAVDNEDKAFKITQKDWTVDKLRSTNQILDSYMSAIRAIISGYTTLPDSEPNKQKAKELLQLWKEFNFKIKDSYSSESSKVLNIWREVEKRKDDAKALNVLVYFQKAVEQANTIQQLLDQRFIELSKRVIGESKTARDKTDIAVRQIYKILNSLQVLMPTDELEALIRKLKAIEEYTKQYYFRDTSSSISTDNETEMPVDETVETNEVAESEPEN